MEPAVSIATEPAGVPAGPGVVQVTFKPQVAIRSHWILLGDVAELSGLPEARLKELAAMRIAHVPQPGVERAVTPEDVRRRLRTGGLRATVEFAGPVETARVTAAIKPLSGDELVRFGHAFLEKKAARPGAEVRIEDPDVPRTLNVPDTGIELKADVSARRLVGLVPVMVEAWADGERVARVMLSYRVHARVTGVQAARSLEPGTVLAEADLTDAEADLAEVPEDAATSRDTLVGQRVLRPMQAGAWVRRSAVAQPLQVRRGSQVMLVARIGSVEARASAQAREEGGAGDIITVVNLNSKRSLRARVVGAGLVEAVMP
ncbi:MAG: flagellar basal body P-ring formation chaperone FlgA [Candidatus Coatesbacteria bacterium]